MRHLRTALALLAMAWPFPLLACRYNVREIGFVETGPPAFRLVVFVHADEQAAWLPQFHQIASEVFRHANVVTEVIDETQATTAPELPLRAQLGPRLPGAMLLAPGRSDGWPIFLHFQGAELRRKLETLIVSDGRRQLAAAAVESYGAVLLLRGTDETANQQARTLANVAIAATKANLAELPKRISEGPRLVEVDPTLPDEQILAWSLGVDGKDLATPVAAVIYGRGRLAGPALQGATLTELKLREQLAVVGADCECTMDHGWMKARAVPFTLESQHTDRLRELLGFDPGDSSVRAEVSQILAIQSQAAANPGAPKLGGYREVPLEVVAIEPTAETSPSSPLAKPADHRHWLTTSLLGILLAILAATLWARHKGRN